MHTARILAAGFALLGLLLLIAPRLKASGARPIVFAAKIFVPLWFAVALVNLWIGINRAGYSAAQEWPIFLVVFGVPAAVAWLLRWWFGRDAA
jgi:hypothetical protein